MYDMYIWDMLVGTGSNSSEGEFQLHVAGVYLIIPLFHRDFGSSFTRRKQGLFLLVTYGRLLCHSLMNLICVC